MGSMRRPVIEFSSLRAILDECEYELAHYREAVIELLRLTYGERHSLLTVEDRHHRLTLYKLANLIGHLELVSDMDLYDICHRCPLQLRRYGISLQQALDNPSTVRLGDNSRTILYEANSHLSRIIHAVCLSSEGLS